MSVFALLGRMCLSLIFILSGIAQVVDWQGTEGMLMNGICDLLNYNQGSAKAQEFLQDLVPWTRLLLIVAVFCQLVGGVFLFFGIKVRFAAFLLLLFLIPATITFHAFWYLQGAERQLQMIMFLKNLSIFGGLLYVLSFGKGTEHHAVKKREKGSEK